MRNARKGAGLGLLVCALSGAWTLRGQELITGMNVVNPLRASVADQNALIEQLKGAHVHVVRCSISSDAKGIDFAKRLHEAGIKIDLILGLQYPKDAPLVAYNQKFPNMWGGHPLSYADAELSRTYFESLLRQLDAEGIELAAVELGNEINWTAFNAEFPRPGTGRVLSLKDLSSDPEGKQIAKGYVQYVKVLAALKEVRDQSTVNQRTPILSAGLSDPGRPRGANGGKADAVAIDATIWFLKQHGLDKYVDGYGVHEYSGEANAQAQKKAILSTALDACGTGAPGKGKKCWITEWGLNNADTHCPLKDTARAAMAQTTMSIFRGEAASGKVAAAIYFSWNSDPWSKQVSLSSVYRCGEVTKTARVALQP